MEMIAVFSQPDATLIGTVVIGVPAIIAAISSLMNGRKLKSNGGSSPVDTMNRTETKVDQALTELKAVAADLRELHGRVDQLEEAFTNPPAQGHIRRRTSA